MPETTALNEYLDRFRRRLARRQWSIGVAVAAAAGLLVMLVSAWVAVRLGFADSHIATGRLLFVGAIVAAVVFLGWLPARRLASNGIATIEARAPAMNGRIETYAAMSEHEPLRDLLAEETLEIAGRFPPERQIASRELAVPWLVAGGAVLALGLLTVFGPGNYGHALRHLLAGWAVDGLTPPQTLVVTPGDETVRRGASLRIVAEAAGFEPDEATLYMAADGDDWREVPMRERGQGFERTLFSVRSATRYYVRAGSVRSETFVVDVVDLPDVDALRLTFRYPEWTGRDDEIVEPGGDVRAVAGTEVVVELLTDEPLPAADLVLDGATRRVNVDTSPATVSFVVANDGEYHVAARVGDEQVRLTDDYFVTVEEDEAPDIRFAQPGRDWKASQVEEVTTTLVVSDDYRLDRATLNYSVNGGDWQTVEFEPDGAELEAEHVFFLESLGPDDGVLQPGDLVSYYAEAVDRERTTRSDMFFVEVQPFDQRYSQSQQSGGGGGDQMGTEISERQREIIVSTWNLIREQAEDRSVGDTFIDDNAQLLSELQATLRSQAISLADRSRARQLSGDQDIARFIGHLEDAAAAMEPASERLAAVNFRDALGPEQQALQHLLRAEAVFRDISISMQTDRGDGGGQAGRDLSEMFELEMDLEKNQYETGSQASAESASQELDDIAERLAELARRQQQLAERLAQRTPTPAERWRQEQLRREAEQLKRELEQQRSSAGTPSSQQQTSAGGESSNSESQPQSGEPSESSESSDASSESADTAQQANAGEPSRGERRREELQRRMESALRAMDATDQALEQDGDMQAAADAAAEAGRALSGATQAAQRAADAALQEQVADFERRARELVAEQRDAARELTEAMSRATGYDDGLTEEQREQLIEQKRAMQSELGKLEQDMKAIARALQQSDPTTAAELERGLKRLDDDAVKERLALAAMYIEQREAQFVASSESLVTDALEALAERAQRAAESAGRGGQRPGDPTSEALAATRALRTALESLDALNTDPSSDFDTIRREGGLANRGRALRGEVDEREISIPAGANLDDDIRSTASNVRRAANEIANTLGLSADEANELRSLARELAAAAAVGRNESIVEDEYRRVIDLLDQVELALTPTLADGANGVRVESREIVESRHRDAIAEYYRRLGATANDSGDR
ncbi:MAG: hypothetical protein AAFX44_01595 [Pseudomonadota bacterium]